MIRVVVICEDHALDQYILKPVVEAVFGELGRRCRIQFESPYHRGVANVLNVASLQAMCEKYPMANLFLVVVDRDCIATRQHSMSDCMAKASSPPTTLLGCLAIEEVEVWALALHRKSIPDDWTKLVRTHCHPKEAYFEPLAKANGWYDIGVGKGRKAAMSPMREKGKWDSLKQGCPEIAELVEAIRQWLVRSALP